jgi:cell division transport system permease protein
MRFSSLRYLAKQGWHSMAANRLMSFASVGVLTACLMITGVAMLLFANASRVVDYMAAQNEILAYLYVETSDADAEALANEIEAIPNVREARYISKADAFLEMNADMEGFSDLLAGLEGIFPARYLVTVEDLNFVGDTNAQLRALPEVEETQVPSEMTGILLTLQDGVTYGGFAIVIILALVSVVVISNTIRLTVFARRREISIMKYVGATNAFIRFPFFVEGMTVGLLAGLISAGAVCGTYALIYGYLQEMYNTWVMSLMGELYAPGEVVAYLILGFAALGVCIGGFGTAMSVRKHLKV